jgi:hypothetical protein
MMERSVRYRNKGREKRGLITYLKGQVKKVSLTDARDRAIERSQAVPQHVERKGDHTTKV